VIEGRPIHDESPAARLYRMALDRADHAVRLVVIFAMVTMIVVVSIQVVLRYVFNSSIDWADEIARLAFVWSIFLTIPLGIRNGAHVGIELFLTRVNPSLRTWLARLMSLLAAALMGILFYESILVAAETWDELLPTINMTSSTFFVPVIIGAGHSCLHLIQLLWRDRPTSLVSAE
jgi:TRAP-type C4-dicarboxylate transport system permease small subunit